MSKFHWPEGVGFFILVLSNAGIWVKLIRVITDGWGMGVGISACACLTGLSLIVTSLVVKALKKYEDN